MSIGLRIILSCTAPIILMGGIYIALTFYNAANTTDREISNWASIISSTLMESSAQAMVTGQMDFLDQQAVKTIISQAEIASLQWHTRGETLFYQTADKQKTDDDTYPLRYPVYFRQVDSVDAFDSDLQVDEAQDTAYQQQRVGTLTIQFDRQYMLQSAYQDALVKLGWLLALLGLVAFIAAIHAVRLSRSIRHVFAFINQLDQGDYRQKLAEDNNKEIHALHKRLNKLAETLQSNQDAIAQEKASLNTAISHLTEARNEADKANDWLKKMLGILSHEMRTPLNAIVGSIDMAISQSRSPFVIKRLENAISHASHMVSELENLLDYIQIDDHKAILTKTPTNIYSLLHIIVENYRPIADEKGLSIKLYHLGEDNNDQLYLLLDQQRFGQIVINLVSNAIKFSDKGEICITSHIRTIEDKKYQVSVEVSDQGIGISEDKLQDIFSIFQQLDLSIARQHGGLGIGLALSKKYVDMMGGSLSVRSQQYHGSSFTFVIEAENTGAKQSEYASYMSPSLQAASYETIQKILIVEDNIVNSNILCELLKRAIPNVGIHTISDGQEAMSFINSDEYQCDLALIDIHLPGLSGIELIRRLRECFPDQKIAAITADSTYATQDACFAAGASLFINKPVRLHDIYRILN